MPKQNDSATKSYLDSHLERFFEQKFEEKFSPIRRKIDLMFEKLDAFFFFTSPSGESLGDLN